MAKKKTAQKTTQRKPVTALARRPQPAPQPAPPQVVELRVNDPERMLPAVLEHGLLTDEASVGNLGMVEVKLTAAEELVLSKAVNVDDVLIKPDGIVYVSHPTYTKWFNEAFGRLGWSLVPKAKAIKAGNLVVVPYVLYIHGHPAAFAQGEQDYHDNNKTQSFGDAIEATVASALRRCAKRLGVGLELWDKAWIRAFVQQHAVEVKTQKGYQWRLKKDPPFWNELRGGRPAAVADDGDVFEARDEEREQAPVRTVKAGTHSAEDEPITKEQRSRMVTIAQRAGRIDADVAMWLKRRHGYNSSAEIKRKDYDAICDQLGVRGALPMPGDGE